MNNYYNENVLQNAKKCQKIAYFARRSDKLCPISPNTEIEPPPEFLIFYLFFNLLNFCIKILQIRT